jgi:virulence-associated protein VagC
MADQELVKEQTTDISDKDMEKVNKFIEDGMPGVSTVNDTTLTRMFSLYLGGSTYWQISNIVGVKRPLIMFMSHKFDWYAARREYLTELQEQIKGRVIDSRLVSQDFLLTLTAAWQKKIGKKLQRYLATDDDEHANAINLKEVAQLLKTIEMIQDLDKEGRDSKGRQPAVGLNLGDGVTIERNGDKVTITPKEKSIGDMLKQFADTRRAEESKVKAPREDRDIDKEVSKTENQE